MIKGKFRFDDLKRFKKQLEELTSDSQKISDFCSECSKELTMKLLELVIKRTPVADSITYMDSKGKKKVVKNGGTLRRGWTAKSEKEAETGQGDVCTPIEEYVNSLPIKVERK